MVKTRLQTKEDADGSLRRSDTLLELERTFPSSETDVSQGYLDHDSFDSVDLKQEKKPLMKPLSMDSPQKDGSNNNKLDATAEKYLSLREMTPLQERMNAVTIAPNPIYCAYFILAGHWISQELMEEYRDQVKLSVDESQCIQSSWFPALSAVPPATVIAVFIAITVHAPFSFLYHWKYAIELSPLQRSSHWSRRMDHSMIHTASAIISYATSGSWQYTLANILFNLDCIYRQFQPKVYPKRNQIRVFISMTAYTIPILNRGEYGLFGLVWLVLGVSGWLFAAYPFKGWSHSIFHMVILFLPPVLMQAATTLSSSQQTMRVAAQCAVLAERAIATR